MPRSLAPVLALVACAPSPAETPPDSIDQTAATSLPICINEFMADNDETLDVAGKSPDWIELHNPSAESVPLEGWTLGDEAFTADLTGREVSANGFLLLYANDEDLGFKLSKDGEALVLAAPNGVSATVNYGDLDEDKSAARVSDCCVGDDCWSVSSSPTPGSTNTPVPVITFAAVTLGSEWTFLDEEEPPPGWPDVAFDDGSWPMGPAPLGYGDPHIVTGVDPGPDPNDKRMTTPFRHRFFVEGVVAEATLSVMRDDGVLVWLDGQEIARDNLPEGFIDLQTPALNSADDETGLQEFDLDPALLPPGEHVLAVEVHQADPASSDLGFDLSLDLVLEGSP